MPDDDILHRILLTRIARGEEPALAALYEAFGSRVYNTALSYVQNTAEAEELTQDVFVTVFRAAAQFSGNASVSTWIYRITVNKALDHLKFRSRQKRSGLLIRLFGPASNAPVLDLPHFDHPGVAMEQKENARILFQAIQALPEQQKTAFILSFVEELPRQEVADILQVSLKAVESLLQRAKSNLRARLDNFFPDRRI